MPTLEFKGKQHIYAHHLTVPYRTLEPDTGRSMPVRPSEDALTAPPERPFFHRAG